MVLALLTAVAALLVLTLLPGPDLAVVTRSVLGHGFRAGVWTAAGIVSGLLVWGLLTVAGLAALLAVSATAYTVVKLAGAGYLVWLGARTLWLTRHGRPAAAPAVGPEGTGRPGRPWRSGFLTNVSNPKIAVFYTSLLPQLVPDGAPHALTLTALVLVHGALTIGWLSLYAAGISRFSAVLRRPRVRLALERCTGVVLVAFGIRVATSGVHAVG